MQQSTGNNYRQLTQKERYQIKAFLEIKRSQTEIAAALHRSKSIISREIKRNSIAGSYSPTKAEELAVLRKRRAEKYSKKSQNLLRILKDWLLIGWSPEAISCRFAVELGASCRVCHSTLYSWLKADKLAGGKLYTLLPRFGKRRKKAGKRKRAGTYLIPDRVSIDQRPEIVEKRLRIGDWE